MTMGVHQGFGVPSKEEKKTTRAEQWCEFANPPSTSGAHMSQPIVVGVDGSGRSLRALLWPRHHAAAHQCPLRLIYVAAPLGRGLPFFPPGHFEEVERGTDELPSFEAVAVVPRSAP